MSAPENATARPRRRPEERTRARVLALLRSHGAALAVGEVAEPLGLHVNSARLHLEHLARAGLVTRDTRRRAGRGRPSVVYAATPLPAFEPDGDDGSGRDSGFRLLAEILAGHVESTSPRPAEAAAEAGRSWGRALAGRSAAPPAERAAGEAPGSGGGALREAAGELVDLMDALGFAPRPGASEEAIELHRCPFGQVAERHSAVVCGVHLGLIQGALEERGGPVSSAVLEPFATPQMCLARLEAASAGE